LIHFSFQSRIVKLRSYRIRTRRFADSYDINVDHDDGNNFIEDSESNNFIGRGAISFVRLARRRQDGLIVAVKSTPIANLSSFDFDGLRKEAIILKKALHPNIVHLYDYFEDAQNCYTVMEYLEGGSLLNYLLEMHIVPEVQVRSVIRAIVSALECCHSFGIVHRFVN
jgi:serine/threonine protein kinase